MLNGLEPEYDGVLSDMTGVIIVSLFVPWTLLAF